MIGATNFPWLCPDLQSMRKFMRNSQRIGWFATIAVEDCGKRGRSVVKCERPSRSVALIYTRLDGVLESLVNDAPLRWEECAHGISGSQPGGLRTKRISRQSGFLVPCPRRGDLREMASRMRRQAIGSSSCKASQSKRVCRLPGKSSAFLCIADPIDKWLAWRKKSFDVFNPMWDGAHGSFGICGRETVRMVQYCKGK